MTREEFQREVERRLEVLRAEAAAFEPAAEDALAAWLRVVHDQARQWMVDEALARKGFRKGGPGVWLRS